MQTTGSVHTLSGYTAILSSVVDYLNANYTGYPDGVSSFLYNELNPRGDSIAISTSTTEAFSETTELCGWIDGKINATVILRRLQTNKGDKDFDLCAYVQDVLMYIQEHIGDISGTGWFIDSFSLSKSPVLCRVYDNGVRDYVGNFTLNYERKG